MVGTDPPGVLAVSEFPSLGAAYTLAITTGAYSISGKPVALALGRFLTLNIDTGVYSVGGQAVGLPRHYTIGVASGTYSINGLPVDFGATGRFILSVEAGLYSITGRPVSFSFVPVQHHTLSINAGAYTITGRPVSLAHGLYYGDTEIITVPAEDARDMILEGETVAWQPRLRHSGNL
ncbi:MAG: hypothetical protein E6R03_00670 [Hyphomicrobiaceae bacterium]|nr:MAG: hypothetical protein E6R03_00670 [Hyphomicrobiaceae bacterium]